MPFSQAIRGACIVLVLCITFYFFPLFHIRAIDSEHTNRTLAHPSSTNSATHQASALDVPVLLETLWTEKLPAAAQKAVRADELLALASNDATSARKKYGREVGLGGATFLFVRGQGKIATVSEDLCRLDIDDCPQCIGLEIGIILGNAVRDATGLLDVEDFSNSQDFNHLSSQLNSRCETEVIAPIRSQLIVGAEVEFVGCGEVRSADDFKPLRLIPVQLRVLDERGQE